jgi:hypothetical protein
VTYLTVASEQPGDVGTRAKAALAELEHLDPEGVKKARSLMAFGFLARARSTAPAAGAQRPESTPGADAATDASNSAMEGFQASAADRATEADDASDIPQPPGYVEVPPTDESLDEEPTEEATEEADETVAAPVEAPPEPATYSRPLVIGVPLAAAFVFMTIYWLILRWGAM